MKCAPNLFWLLKTGRPFSYYARRGVDCPRPLTRNVSRIAASVPLLADVCAMGLRPRRTSVVTGLHIRRVAYSSFLRPAFECLRCFHVSPRRAARIVLGETFRSLAQCPAALRQ